MTGSAVKVVPALRMALRQLLAGSRRLTVTAAAAALVVGASISLLGLAARQAVNQVAAGHHSGWVTAGILIGGGVITLMAATWVNYGAVTALSLRLGRQMDLSAAEAEQQRAATDHLDTGRIAELAVAVDEQRDAISALPSALNGVVVLLASAGALLGMAVAVSPLLALLFLGLAVVAAAAMVAQQRLTAVTLRTAMDTRLTRSLFALMTAAGPAKDIRTGGTGRLLVNRYRSVWDAQDAQLHRARRHGVVVAAGAEVIVVGVFAASLLLTFSSQRMDAGTAVLAFIVATQAAAISGAVYPALSSLSLCLSVYAQHAELVNVDTPRERDRPAAAFPDPGGRDLWLDRAVVRYQPDGVPALDGVSLRVQPGSLVAVVGENGSGKSTLVSVLLGLRRPDSGESQAVGAVPSGQAAAVFQDYARIESTLREGVSFGALGATDDQVLDGLAAVGAERFAQSLPRGLDTLLGTRSRPGGTELSGGQWQRVALARAAMVAQPRLLVLDEASSNLDVFAEQQLIASQLAVARRSAGAAVVFVTHRLVTARLADVIHVLSEGRIVESGTHDELVARGGMYAEMYAVQARGYA
ncbi:MAG TPA: ATP-binding cassette domain-containing protein [Streptosporangiaceae bacterium]|nr:ATP-binding cassette domain-containing protein [Streptosporangiaceae bacterium]